MKAFLILSVLASVSSVFADEPRLTPTIVVSPAPVPVQTVAAPAVAVAVPVVAVGVPVRR
jgi:hypothetical protein